jgi:hypothetical protein
MNHVYESVGRPGIFRNDRFWLAGDHRVEPALYDLPDVKRLMNASRHAHQELKMTEFQGFNVCNLKPLVPSRKPSNIRISVVHYHAHRVRPRTCFAWPTDYWRRLPFLFCRRSILPLNRNGCYGCRHAPYNGPDMVYCARDSLSSLYWASSQRYRRKGYDPLHLERIQAKHNRRGKDCRVQWSWT